MESMNADVWVNVGAVVAVGTFLWRNQKAMGDRIDRIEGAIGELRRDIVEIRRDIADLRERMGRLEGLFQGFTQGKKAPDA